MHNVARRWRKILTVETYIYTVYILYRYILYNIQGDPVTCTVYILVKKTNKKTSPPTKYASLYSNYCTGTGLRCLRTGRTRTHHSPHCFLCIFQPWVVTNKGKKRFGFASQNFASKTTDETFVRCLHIAVVEGFTPALPPFFTRLRNAI